MKFAKRLAEEAVPAWRAFYVDYKRLKKALKLGVASADDGDGVALSSSPGGEAAGGPGAVSVVESSARFLALLQSEVDKVNGLVASQRAAWRVELARVDAARARATAAAEGGDMRAAASLRAGAAAAEGDIWHAQSRLRSFAELNYTACYKALKKHDKVTGRSAMDAFMAHVEMQPFFSLLSAVSEAGASSHASSRPSSARGFGDAAEARLSLEAGVRAAATAASPSGALRQPHRSSLFLPGVGSVAAAEDALASTRRGVAGDEGALPSPSASAGGGWAAAPPLALTPARVSASSSAGSLSAVGAVAAAGSSRGALGAAAAAGSRSASDADRELEASERFGGRLESGASPDGVSASSGEEDADNLAVSTVLAAGLASMLEKHLARAAGGPSAGAAAARRASPLAPVARTTAAGSDSGGPLPAEQEGSTDAAGSADAVGAAPMQGGASRDGDGDGAAAHGDGDVRDDTVLRATLTVGEEVEDGVAILSRVHSALLSRESERGTRRGLHASLFAQPQQAQAQAQPEQEAFATAASLPFLRVSTLSYIPEGQAAAAGAALPPAGARAEAPSGSCAGDGAAGGAGGAAPAPSRTPPRALSTGASAADEQRAAALLLLSPVSSASRPPAGASWEEHAPEVAATMAAQFERSLRLSYEHASAALQLVSPELAAQTGERNKRLARFTMALLRARDKARALLAARAPLRALHDAILASKLELYRYMIKVRGGARGAGRGLRRACGAGARSVRTSRPPNA